tara:strand:- start:18221 stop:18400 length:180 start_codon:yes stop_codon:yes gene_type:complete
MDTFRVKFVKNGNTWKILDMPDVDAAETKQKLYKILKEDYGITRFYTRRHSVVCVKKEL